LRPILIALVVIVVGSGAAAYCRLVRQAATSDLTDFGRRRDKGSPTETATFAAGCFWKLEHAMRNVDGVVSTEAGYAGGDAPGDGARGDGAPGDVSHSTVASGRTGHAEAVRVTFDPARVSYDRLLAVFFSSHDPMSFVPVDGEPPGPGRSAVFYHSGAQRAAAAAFVRRLDDSGKYKVHVPTAVVPAGTFLRAEPEHQQYLERHAPASCGL